MYVPRAILSEEEYNRLHEVERLAGELAEHVAVCSKAFGCRTCSELARVLKAKIKDGK